jgi:hypothetical protein
MGHFASRTSQPVRLSRRVPSTCRPHLEALEDRCLLSGAGSLDTSFGGTGVVTTSNLGQANAVLIQPDGKIVAAGEVLTVQRYEWMVSGRRSPRIGGAPPGGQSHD